MPQPDTRVRPSPWWYLAVVVLWIGSFVVFIIAIRPIISIFSAGVDPVRNDSQINVPGDGVTIYTSIRPAGATCTLTGADGPVQLKPFDTDSSSTFTFTVDDGTDVHPIASTRDDFPAGQYQLSCEVPQRATLATGKRVDFGSFAARLVIGVIGSIVAGLAGLVILIVMLVKRHNSKQRVRQAQAAAAYGYGGYPGYPPGGYPQGGYPQSGQADGGYPQAGTTPPESPSTSSQAPYGSPRPPPSPPLPPPPPPGPSEPDASDDPGTPPEDRR
jgi:hypothetical protein